MVRVRVVARLAVLLAVRVLFVIGRVLMAVHVVIRLWPIRS
jgi:hypothetical protein